MKITVKPAKIRGTSPHSFRRGEWATVVGVVMARPDKFNERPCFVAMYADGFVDYKVVSELGISHEIQAEDV
jgi:hypothetical protein